MKSTYVGTVAEIRCTGTPYEVRSDLYSGRHSLADHRADRQSPWHTSQSSGGKDHRVLRRLVQGLGQDGLGEGPGAGYDFRAGDTQEVAGLPRGDARSALEARAEYATAYFQ